jgi:pyruvate dehydrogenase E2 component (dihydrolipoamide acetyltransferase)
MSIEFKLPELGENIEKGDIVNVLVKEGDEVAANQGLLELETDKAVVELPCPYAGKIVKLHVAKGQSVSVGQTLATIEPADAPAQPAPTAAEKQAAPPAAPQALPAATVLKAEPASADLLPAGPAARRLARQMGVDLGQVQGSGPRGRITPEDVQRSAEAVPAAVPSEAPVRPRPEAAPPRPAELPGTPGEDRWGPVRREPLTQIRRTIAARMVQSASTIPHVTNFDDADVTDLERLRQGIPPGYVGANIKLSITPFVIRAVALALKAHPALNASLDPEKEQIVYKDYVHIGIAVDTPRGLVVPAIRDVDRMSIPEIARALASVANRARSAQFAVEDLRGGTFTVSNLGAVGGTYSTPIINYPEVALLLFGRSRWLPVVVEGRVEPRWMLPLSLSFDHRLIDGAQAGRFLNEVIGYLQAPGRLLL